MSLKILQPGSKIPRTHSVRFTSDDLPKYKSMDSPESLPNYVPNSYTGPDSGAPSPDACSFQPAAHRFRVNEQRLPESLPNYVPTSYTAGTDSVAPNPDACSFQPVAHLFRVNEQRIKLLTAINQIVQQRADLESNRVTLSNLLDELRRKLKRRVEECHFEKKEKMKALKQANQRLEREKFSIVTEIEHLKRHLEREEAHHIQHARTAVAQAIQGVTKLNSDHIFTSCSVADLPNVVSRSVAKNAPSRIADNKLAAARLMRDIAELRQRVAQVEARLANEMKRKRQAELDIIRLRKELSTTKSCVASLRMPLQPLRKPCSKFA